MYTYVVQSPRDVLFLHRDCLFGDVGTAVLIYRVEPNTCTRIKHADSATDKYVLIETDGLGNVTTFKNLCDGNCSNCPSTFKDVKPGSCFSVFGQGSAIISEHFCAGSPNLQLMDDGLSVFYYSNYYNPVTDCSIQKDGSDDVSLVPDAPYIVL